MVREFTQPMQFNLPLSPGVSQRRRPAVDGPRRRGGAAVLVLHAGGHQRLGRHAHARPPADAAVAQGLRGYV